MKRFLTWRSRSIKEKLIRICILTTAFALLVTTFAFIGSELLNVRRSLKSTLLSFAATIASNVQASLSFGDYRTAAETLATLSSVPNIPFAVLYDMDGHVFATYQRGPMPEVSRPSLLKMDPFQPGLRHVDVYHRITLDGDRIGMLHIRWDMTKFYAKIAVQTGMMLIVSLLSLIFAYFMVVRLQRMVTAPIVDLAGLMRDISENRNYSLRAAVHGSDEVGALAEGFNDMLVTIEARRRELESYRRHLEELVQERTVQLRETNRQLQEELTERTRMEKALIESEHRYRAIFETTGNASMITEEDNTISEINGAFERLSGYSREEVEGKKQWPEFFSADIVEKMKHYHALRRLDPQAPPNSYEASFVDRMGNAHQIYLSASIIPGSTKAVGSMLDITNLKRLEAQLRQSQKMEAIGQLAGGVAHDFNNILTAIIGYATILNMKLPVDQPTRAYVDAILSSAERATNVTTGLLAFSRKQVLAVKAVNVTTVISGVEKLLTRLMGEDIELKTSYCGEPLTIFADAGQIGQVLINLATNARDAMPDGGTFSIATRMADLHQDSPERYTYQKPGRYAEITVSDTGTGMSQKTIDRIFEPFFTTKEVGKGTGLGLSIVYGIIKQHNGYIQAHSSPGAGARFVIHLPLTKAEVQDTALTKQRRLEGGSETLLLAEDDASTRALIKEILEKYGYSVIEAADGEEAVSRFAGNKDVVDLVILDVIMPKKNGKVVYEGIREMKPGIKALFISGYTADIIHSKGVYEENLHFLAKPIMPDDLVAKVRAMLDEA
jgi:PAS domain S-box-containing protein